MSVEDSVNVNLRDYQGATIGDRYYLERFLDEGGFGGVFKASHQAYGVELREVAIKIAKHPMSDAEARRRFCDALEMAWMADRAPEATLREHFVTVHDAGRCPEGGPLAGHPYVVMEFMPGGSLSRSLRAGAFPLTRAINYFNQILRAVAFMHGRGKIHRDLKPSNILVERRQAGEDLLKVADFGLVIEVGELLGWAESGGDLTYMAPESFSDLICSRRSDVYMLGVVFYHMLAGYNPFATVGRHLRGTEQEKQAALRRLHFEARQLEAFPELDCNEELKLQPALREVIRKALKLDPETRPFKSAGELLAAWRQAQNPGDDPPPPEPPPPWELVAQLTNQAKRCFAVGDQTGGDVLLEQALTLNRDSAKVPDPMVVGDCYLQAVKRRLEQGRKEEAGSLANEGHQRRGCASTYQAMALYCEAEGSPLAATYRQQAAACRDRT